MMCEEGIVELLKAGPAGAAYIARRLGAPRECVEKALRRLRRRGLVEYVDGKWRLAVPNDAENVVESA